MSISEKKLEFFEAGLNPNTTASLMKTKRKSISNDLKVKKGTIVNQLKSTFGQSTESQPIVIENSSAVNILDIHKLIMEKFKADMESLPIITAQINKLSSINCNESTSNSNSNTTSTDDDNNNNNNTVETSVNNGNCNLSKSGMVSDDTIASLMSKKVIIESGVLEAQYIHAAKPLLLKYRELLNQKIKIDFFDSSTSTNSCVSVHDNNEKNTVITEYLNIAKNFINIKILDIHLQIGKQCPECNVDYVKLDDMQFICPNCGITLNTLANTMNYQDDSRINSASRYMYDKQGHFRDAIKKFQGKQNTTVPQDVYDSIDRKIKSYGIPICKVTKTHIKEFLKATGKNKYAEDINLIYFKITGVKPPDITQHESALNAFYDQIEPIYERIKPPGRVNFMNGQYVLFKLLQKLKYPCTYDDFATLKTRDRVLEHDSFWKQICEELCWTFQPTI